MTDAARVITLAKYLARKAIRERLQDCGIRPLELEPSEINKATNAYLEVRRVELIAEAKAILSR